MIEYKSNNAEFLWFLIGYSFIGIGFSMFKYKSNCWIRLVPYWLVLLW